MGMQKQSWRERTQPWVAAGFCAFVSLITVAVNLSRLESTGMNPFLCALPMCFVFVAYPMILMRKEIEELRSRLDEVQRS
jgi:hypothetical protein